MSLDLWPCALCGRLPATRNSVIGPVIYCACRHPKKRQVGWVSDWKRAVAKWNETYGKEPSE